MNKGTHGSMHNLDTRQEVSVSHTGHLTRRPEAPDIHWTGSCVGVETGLDALEMTNK